MLRAVVQQRFVRLVRDDPQIVRDREFRDLLQVLRRRDRTQRVGRAVDQDGLRLRGQAFFQILRLDVKLVLFIDRNVHDADAGHVRHADIRRVVRAGDQDLVARIHRAQHGHQQRMGGSVEHVHVGRRAFDALLSSVFCHDRFAQSLQSRVGDVFRRAVVHGGIRGVDHVPACREPRLADTEIDRIFILQCFLEYGAHAGKSVLSGAAAQFHFYHL